MEKKINEIEYKISKKNEILLQNFSNVIIIMFRLADFLINNQYIHNIFLGFL